MTGGAWTALRPSLPLLVWAGHFTAIYAVHAVACERGLAGARVLGLGFVPLGVGIATLAAVLALAWLFRRAEIGAIDGPEAEPAFRRWLLGAFVLAAGLAVLFQALPAFVLPAC